MKTKSCRSNRVRRRKSVPRNPRQQPDEKQPRVAESERSDADRAADLYGPMTDPRDQALMEAWSF